MGILGIFEILNIRNSGIWEILEYWKFCNIESFGILEILEYWNIGHFGILEILIYWEFGILEISVKIFRKFLTSVPVFQCLPDKWDTFCVGGATCQRKVDGTGGDKLIDAFFHLFHSRTDKSYTAPPPPNFHEAEVQF